jgi:ribosomal RNA methyltransferase Nop2
LLQLQHDIATYFGYNNYLVGKLMVLFSAAEVSHDPAMIAVRK